MAVAGQADIRHDASYQVNDVLAAKVSSAVTKEAMFTVRYQRMELAGIASRLAAALCVYANTGRLDGNMVAGGADIALGSVRVAGRPVASGEAEVFIPRRVDKPVDVETFYALVRAVNGEGSTVRSDMVFEDDLGRPILPACEDGRLAQGCLNALHLVGANMEMAGAGSIFSYAVAVGTARGLTVPGHTDEGAWFRRALRSFRFAPPYGALMPDEDHVPGLPVVADYNPIGYVGLMDTLALTSAALVSVSDPCAVIDGRTYPVIVTDPVVRVEAAGTTTNRAGDPARVAAEIYHHLGRFSEAYGTNLAKLMCVTGAEDTTARLITASVTTINWAGDAHLARATVAPFFWVEPTGLLPHIFDSSRSVAAGHSVVCSPDKPAEKPAFDGVAMVKEIGMAARFAFDYTSLRSTMGLLHLLHHPKNGLGHTAIAQMDPERVALPGGQGLVRDRMIAGLDFAGVAWGRGHSALPAPAEALYVNQGKIGVNVGLLTADGIFDYTPTHFPRVDELTKSVRVSVSIPILLRTCPLDRPETVVSRVRTSGAVALSRARRSGGVIAHEDLFPVRLGGASAVGDPATNIPPIVSSGGGLLPAEVVPGASGVSGVLEHGRQAAPVHAQQPKPVRQTGQRFTQVARALGARAQPTPTASVGASKAVSAEVSPPQAPGPDVASTTTTTGAPEGITGQALMAAVPSLDVFEAMVSNQVRSAGASFSDDQVRELAQSVRDEALQAAASGEELPELSVMTGEGQPAAATHEPTSFMGNAEEAKASEAGAGAGALEAQPAEAP